MKSIILAILAILSITCASASKATPIAITVSTEGRFASGNSWEITVSEAGEAQLTVYTYPAQKRKFNISEKNLKKLRDAVIQKDFFGLSKDSYGELVPSGSTVTAIITQGDKKKKVEIHFLGNWVKSNPEKLKEPAKALEVLQIVRSWFSDEDAVDLRKYDKIVIEAANKG